MLDIIADIQKSSALLAGKKQDAETGESSESHSGTSQPPKIAQHRSLIKYDNPSIVSIDDPNVALEMAGGASAELYRGPCGDPGTTRNDTMAILSAILPPREWHDEFGNLMRQSVSHMPATGIDVINLADRLNVRLKHEQARETGICPIRRKLYADTFDEIIRQATITCAERGLLLVAVRDEAYKTIDTYKNLYASAIAFGMRNLLKSETWHAVSRAKYLEQLEELQELESKAAAQKSRLQRADDEKAAELEALKTKNAAELDTLKKANQDLKAQLEAIILPKKLS